MEGQGKNQEGLSLTRYFVDSRFQGLQAHPSFVLLASEDSLSWGPPFV